MTSGAASQKTVRTGLVFAPDFQNYFSNFGYAADPPVESTAVSENILDYEGLQPAWQEEINLRPRPKAQAAPSGPLEEARDKPGFDAEKLKKDLDDVAAAPNAAPGEQADAINNEEPAKQRIEAAAQTQQEQPAAPVQQEEQESESIEISTISDTPTGKDALAFKPYVEAISKFLLNPETKPPLTLSIEGEWGSGKSSFMLQLRDSVAKESTRQQIKTFSVVFNPWRHDKEDSLWAAFALEFLRQMKAQRFPFRRWWGTLKLFVAHYSWRKGWFELFRAATIWLVMLVLAVGYVEVIIQKPR